MTGLAEPRSLFAKLWDAHVITTSPDGLDLIHIDRSLLTDLSGTVALEEMEEEGQCVRNPALHLAIPDHVIETGTTLSPRQARMRERFVDPLRTLSESQGIRHFDRGSGRQGIVHVVGLEHAFSLPGTTVVCGDSHTSTHGAIGALAWGIGSTEVRHVLATQTLWMKRPKAARIHLTGTLRRGVYSKDVILWLIGQLGADWGREHAVEFTGECLAAMSVEARASICNLGVEMGARFALMAPDDTVVDYLRGRPMAPRGDDWKTALKDWEALQSDPGATFDKSVTMDVSEVTPQITWGVSLEHVGGGSEPVPDAADPAAISYMGVEPGASLDHLPVDYVFVGSCANGRLEDLRVVADIVRGRTLAPGVVGWIVPGSEAVKLSAESEGLHTVLKAAGFVWREPGCSMCNAVNGDFIPPGKRVVSTTNRNFVGRQGPHSRTHLASPATAAYSALAGRLTTQPPRHTPDEERQPA